MSRPDVAGDERTSVGENPREDESALIAALQAGDEAAFRMVFDQFDPTLRRLARSYARADAVAEEIVQETWPGVVRGIGRFEGRSHGVDSRLELELRGDELAGTLSTGGVTLDVRGTWDGARRRAPDHRRPQAGPRPLNGRLRRWWYPSQ